MIIFAWSCRSELVVVKESVRDIGLSGLLLLSGMKSNELLILWVLPNISLLRRAIAKTLEVRRVNMEASLQG